jgi:hypothetical protein
MYNARELTSNVFDDYCMTLGFAVKHLVLHVHTQNGLAEKLIKWLNSLHGRSFGVNFQVHVGGHVVLDVAKLITEHRPTPFILPCSLRKGQHKKFPTFIGY